MSGPGPQSCEKMLGAKLQVRPVPSGSTLRAFTLPSSITMENLPERGAGRLRQPRPGDRREQEPGSREASWGTLPPLPLEPAIPKKGHQGII